MADRDLTEMESIHTISGRTFVVRAYESSADEFLILAVMPDDSWEETLYYNHTGFSDPMCEARHRDADLVAAAGGALVQRFLQLHEEED